MSWTEADLQQVLNRGHVRLLGDMLPAPRVAPSTPAPFILGPELVPFRSKLEALYAAFLDRWQADGMLTRWRYEALRLRLAPKTTLTVDFQLVMPEGVGDGRIQLHETKGEFRREDGMVKLKTAAALYPEFRFFLVTWVEEAWRWQEIPAT